MNVKRLLMSFVVATTILWGIAYQIGIQSTSEANMQRSTRKVLTASFSQ